MSVLMVAGHDRMMNLVLMLRAGTRSDRKTMAHPDQAYRQAGWFSIDNDPLKKVLLRMIRKARIADVRPIQALVNSYAEQGQMLPRSLNDLYENLRDFSVYEVDRTIIGVCALHISWDGLAEIRSLAVQKEMTGKGIGASLVRECLQEAGEIGAERVFVLTYQENFFRKLGFGAVDKKDLPHKIWTDCLNCVKFPNCDETSLIIALPRK